MTGANDAIVNHEEKVESAELTLSTGVVVRPKKIKMTVFLDLSEQLERPKPPIQMMTRRGGRQVEVANYDHPEYKADVEAFGTSESKLYIDAMFGLGLDIVSVPKGLPKVKSNDWLEILEVLNIDVRPESKLWRQINWVKYVACDTPEDISAISDAVGRLSTAKAEEVEQAEEGFRGDKKGS